MVLEKWGSVAFREIRLAGNIRIDLQKLDHTTSNIRAMLLDTEEKHIDQNHRNQHLVKAFVIFEELTNSIGDLKHLRYLDLSENDKIKKLPNSICHLQTLLLGGCKELEELPKDLRMLISLRFFILITKQTCLWDGIGQLESLRFLGIKDCRNLISLPNDMKALAKLSTLLIAECEKLDLKSESNQVVLSISLQRLMLCDLPSMVALPQWLQGNADTLEELDIERCPNLATLPEWLPNLKSLKILAIRDCPKLSSLPDVIQRLSSSAEMQVEKCPCLYEIGKVSDSYE